MARPRITPTGVERFFSEDEIIVSKTDRKGLITYANETFIRMAGFSEAELLGQPHHLIRHPDMPRCVFKLLWETIQAGDEIFAYVVNLSRNGDHYWVLAHVTPTLDARGQIVGYHSNRRVPERAAVDATTQLYSALCAEERRHSDPREAQQASSQLLSATLAAGGVGYPEFVWSL
ncbi:MAG: PAS domain-containing protein [Planctomycetota bacterium]